jgi:hypothetical protein
VYEVDIPRAERRVREFVNGYGECLRCGKRVSARHPLQTSNAQGAVGQVHIGPVAIGLATHLKVVGGMSYEKIQVVMEQVLGFKLARSSLWRAVMRLARKAEPTYQGLIEQIRGSPVVYPDETGWKLAGRNAWLWAVTNLKLTVYSILRGRGYAEAASILGEEYCDSPLHPGRVRDAGSIVHSVVEFVSHFRPGRMARGEVWPTLLYDRRDVDTTPFESAARLFVGLPLALEHISDGARATIHENYMAGGFVPPERVAEVIYSGGAGIMNEGARRPGS